MASGEGPVTAADRAATEARRLQHHWIGPEHVLVALFAEPSPATQALEELGANHERVEEHGRSLAGGGPSPAFVPGQGLSPNPAWYRLTGCAEGLALAEGRQQPGPEHFLLAMVYGAHTLAGLLARVGSSQEALLEGLRRRGVRVPEIDPPPYRPWRGRRRIEVTEAELRPVIDVLIERHPPGSEGRWAFNWLSDEPPRRARVFAEEGVDLDAAVAAARDRAGA